MPKPPNNKVIGESDSFLEVIEQVSHLTNLNRPILVVGERGTGKELIAERVHFLSDRWSKPLTKMNCATVSDALLESELFGHEAGAFTGASKRHIGRFERSDGGTLFLDELATMSLKTQEKLLRFIEYGEFERLGGSSVIHADVRIVAATNVDLPTMAQQNKFRHDLLDRLAFDVITIPPLRCRQEDIVILAEHFAVNMCKELGYSQFSGFTKNALTSLLNYDWPGNIRELKNVIERSVYRNTTSESPVNDIKIDPFESPYRISSPNTSSQKQDVEVAQQKKTNVLDPSPDLIKPHSTQTFKEQTEQFETQLIESALKSAKFNQRTAAEKLGLSYHQLRGLLRKYDLINRE